MFIKFAHSQISEFALGELHFRNTGEPFEVSQSVGEALLRSPHIINGETVSVFERAGDGGDAAAETEETAETFALGLVQSKSKAELEAMADEAGIDRSSLSTKGALAQAIAEKAFEVKENNDVNS